MQNILPHYVMKLQKLAGIDETLGFDEKAPTTCHTDWLPMIKSTFIQYIFYLTVKLFSRPPNLSAPGVNLQLEPQFEQLTPECRWVASWLLLLTGVDSCSTRHRLLSADGPSVNWYTLHFVPCFWDGHKSPSITSNVLSSRQRTLVEAAGVLWLATPALTSVCGPTQ